MINRKIKYFFSFAGNRSRLFLIISFFIIFLSLIIQKTNTSYADTIPAPQSMTPEQIKQISGWDNWGDCSNPPPGTKCSDPITDGVSGNPATYMLVPSDSFTITHNIMGPAVEASAKPVKAIAKWISDRVLEAVIGVLWVIASFCKLLVELAGQTLDLTLHPSLYNFTNNDMINFGWKMVRDICNLFFLLVLLFIAFCTILQIDKYHVKKTLLTLILMALLINFSKPIAIFIFDGSQIAMNYFLKSISNATGGGSTSAIYSSVNGIADIIYKDLSSMKETTVDVAIQHLFGIVFLFMLAIAYFVIAVFLIIRIVAITVLIIVSPLAFFATAIPDFQKLSSSWWSALFNYSYFGPAVAFFLLLATKLSSFTIGLPKLVTESSSTGMTALIGHTLQYLTTLVFLYAAIIMGKQFGLYAADAITSRGTKAVNWGARNLTGYSLAAKAGRGMKNVYTRHKQAATEAGKEALKQKYPRVHRWATKEGADEAAKKFWGEKFGTRDPHRQQQEEAGKHEKDMKDKNYTADDYKNELNSSTSATRRMAAAMALAKMGKLDLSQYEKAINDFEQNPAFKKLFDSEVVKKNVDISLASDLKKAEGTGGPGSLTTAQYNAIFQKHMGKLNPEQMAGQKMSKIIALEKSRGADFTKNMLLDQQTSTDPKKQKLFEKFYTELNPAERTRLEKMGVV